MPFFDNKNFSNFLDFESLYPAIKNGYNIIVLFIAKTLLKHFQYPSKIDITILLKNINGILFRYLIVILQKNKDNIYQYECFGITKFIGSLMYK